jgi:hypothetical protein
MQDPISKITKVKKELRTWPEFKPQCHQTTKMIGGAEGGIKVIVLRLSHFQEVTEYHLKYIMARSVLQYLEKTLKAKYRSRVKLTMEMKYGTKQLLTSSKYG